MQFRTAGATLADVPNTFVAGQTLKARDLNANFAALDARIATFEAAPTHLVSTGNEVQTGAYSADLVYEGMEVTLQPGTWLVDATATLSSSVQSDAVQLGLWDQTNAVDVPDSRGASATSAALNGGDFCGAGSCLLTPTSASAVITVAASTTVRVKAFRNGSSTLTVGPPNTAIVLAPLNRISALRLR